MFTVIYTFKVLPKKEEQFILNWEELTKLIYQYEGSYGSRLHKISDLNYLAYAQWPSKAIWDASWSKMPEISKEYAKKMKAACETSTTNYELEVISDLLAHQAYNAASEEPKATGIGGVFFKSKNPQALKKWYSDNLGIETDQYGSLFSSRDLHAPQKINHLQWSVFQEDSDYFEPSKQDHMINYRVVNLQKLVAQFKENGIVVLDDIATYDYGKFVHILDLDGNKIELWEPIDSAFTN